MKRQNQKFTFQNFTTLKITRNFFFYIFCSSLDYQYLNLNYYIGKRNDEIRSGLTNQNLYIIRLGFKNLNKEFHSL